LPTTCNVSGAVLTDNLKLQFLAVKKPVRDKGIGEDKGRSAGRKFQESSIGVPDSNGGGSSLRNSLNGFVREKEGV